MNNNQSQNVLAGILYFLCLASLNASAAGNVAEDIEEESNPFNECLYQEINKTGKSKTLAELETLCEKKMVTDKVGEIELGAISKRIIKEQKTLDNPYVLTPHKMNYILPIVYTNNVNNTPYKDYSNWGGNLDAIEAKFQLSIKVPLNHRDILIRGDKLYFGFTLESWWQVYNDEISRAFRETNYQPEGFYMAPIDWHPLGGNSGIVLGFEHQSNGRSGLISRSWNRVYASFLFEKNNFAFSFKPWWRIPEGSKKSTIGESANDNPDIIDYMGHFEFAAVYKMNQNYEFSAKIRENFAEHHGAFELGVTFPLWGKLKGYAQYFNGYGESLIDYNHKQQRIGIGIALTNML